MAKRKLTKLRSFTIPFITTRTIGPCREGTCHSCRHLWARGTRCALFTSHDHGTLRPPYHRSDECKQAEREAKADGEA